jgi:hypothetical protein
MLYQAYKDHELWLMNKPGGIQFTPMEVSKEISYDGHQEKMDE